MKNITSHILQLLFKYFIAVITKRKQNKKNEKQNVVSLSIQLFKMVLTSILLTSNLASNYMLKVNDKNTRTRCEICSKLTVKKLEWRQWCRFGVFTVNFWTYFTPCSTVLFLTLTSYMSAGNGMHCNSFLPKVPFWSSWKHEKSKGLLMLSEGSSRNIGEKKVNYNKSSMNLNILFKYDKNTS